MEALGDEERWVLARLRDRTFFSLAELNAAIRELVRSLNERPFQKLPGSRRELLERLARPAMQPLPAESYIFAEWRKARVIVDYHVEVDGHYYSVPYRLVGEKLDVRIAGSTVELLHRGRRVASHLRNDRRVTTPRSPSTCPGRTATTSSGAPSG